MRVSKAQNSTRKLEIESGSMIEDEQVLKQYIYIMEFYQPLFSAEERMVDNDTMTYEVQIITLSQEGLLS